LLVTRSADLTCRASGVGLWLDSELLNGRSEFCETFHNKPLHDPDREFSVVAIEVYGFK
jgi:hypothetical protein